MAADRSGIGWSAWTGDAQAPPPDDALRADHEARYARLGLLGRGGMGEVELARDARLLRDVAIKRVAPDAHPGAGALLVHEARLTAHLQHPGIVSVHDLGIDERGEPWVALALVRGTTLAGALEATREPADRLRWVRHVLSACEAMAYAHQAGVVHRDLKPSNLFVGEFGETQVGDWGLAQVLPGHGWEDILGDAPARGSSGTPAYMAPEQALGAPADPRADVYSLGAVLHEILTGAPPAGVAPIGPPELVAIVGRATHTDPAARYAHAGELAADLVRWLEGRRVEAHRYSTFDLFLRLVRAWRAPLTVAAVALLLLTLGGIGSWLATRAERDRAVLAEAATRVALEEADANLATALVAQARSAWQRGAIAEAEVLAAHAQARGGGPASAGLLAGLAAEPHPTLLAQVPLPSPCSPRHLSPGATRLVCSQPDRSGVWDVGASAPRWTLPHGIDDADFLDEDTVFLAWRTPDGQALLQGFSAVDGTPVTERATPFTSRRFGLVRDGPVAVLHEAQHVTLLGRDGARQLSVCDGNRTGRDAVAVDGGSTLMVACSDGTLQRWSAPFEDMVEVVTPLGHALPNFERMAPLPDGDLVVGTSKGSVVRLGRDGVVRWVRDGLAGPVLTLCVSPDGGHVAAGADRGGLLVLEATRGVTKARLPSSSRGDCTFDDEGRVHVLGTASRTWRLGDALPARYVQEHGMTWVGARDGVVFATAGDGALLRWDGVPTLTRRQDSERTAKGAVVLPDGDLLVAHLGLPGLQRVSPDLSQADVHANADGRSYRRVGRLGDGRIWGGSYALGVHVWDPATDAWGAVAGLEDRRVWEGWSLPDGSGAVLLDESGGVWWLPTEPELVAVQVTTSPDALAVAALPGTTTLLVAGRTEVVALDRSDGATHWSTPLSSIAIDADVSADGALIAIGCLDGATRLLDARTGELLALLPGHTERVGAVSFSRDGAWLLTAGWDGVVRRWATHTSLGVEEVEERWGMSMEEALAAD